MDAEPPVTIDGIFDELRTRVPDVQVERLKVKWPADDDNLWFIRSGGGPEVQIECSPEGRAPFLSEGDDPGHRTETHDVDEAVNTIVQWLTTD